jgi:nitrite reductase/ring-hydroxylating ferredoxin subunit
MRHRVCSIDELEPGSTRSVLVERVAIALIRTPDGNVYALRDTCSHWGAPLSRGKIQELVDGTGPGEYETAPGRYLLQCPWHGYEFDVADGRCPADPVHARVRSYPVNVEEDGSVVVER